MIMSFFSPVSFRSVFSQNVKSQIQNGTFKSKTWQTQETARIVQENAKNCQQLETMKKLVFTWALNLQVFPKSWPGLVRFVIRLARYRKTKYDLLSALSSTDIDLEFGMGSVLSTILITDFLAKSIKVFFLLVV